MALPAILRVASGISSVMGYLLSDGHVPADGLFYSLGFHIALNQSEQASSTGSFTANGGTAFNVDIYLMG